jgi:hypothetical protein
MEWYILIHRGWHTLSGGDTNHSLVVAKVREKLAASRQAAQKFDVERFNHRKLRELEDMK